MRETRINDNGDGEDSREDRTVRNRKRRCTEGEESRVSIDRKIYI